MSQNYSRLQSVEEKRNIKRATLFITLTVGLIILLFIVGIPMFGRFTVFLSDIRSGDKSINKNDTTPPAPPKFDYFSGFTNQLTASVSGTVESGATVKLNFDGKVLETLADKDGSFKINLNLTNGENTFYGVAIDTSGNTSKNTNEYKIILDSKAPALSISSPSDGTSFFGSNQRQVTIQGLTDANSQIVINDRIVSVDDTGKFQYTTTLNDGGNTFIVKSNDQAGNTTEKTINLNFSP